MTQTVGELIALERTQCLETAPAIGGLQWDTQEIAELAMEVGEIALGSKEEWDASIPLVERALTIHEQAFGSEHPIVAFSLNTLAGLYREKGDFDKSEPLYQRALAMLEKVFGPEHPDVATSLAGLAGVYQGKGDFAKAKPLYDRALAILENVPEADGSR